MNLKVLLSTVFVLFLLTQDIKTQIIADALPGCLQIIDQQGVECNNASTTDFGVSGNQFIVNNIDGTSCSCIGGLGNTNAYFIFEVINISGYSNIGISFDYSADNVTYEDLSPVPVYDCNADMAINQSHDQIVFEYAVDGGPWILGEYIHGTTGFDFTGTWTESGINGSTLQIRVIVSAKSSAEKFYFTNLDITGTPNPPSAGSDLSGCPGTPITLQGSGTGTWSGGMGTFGDISNPTTTYTPDASESGTITLFYSGTPPTPGCGNGPTDEMDITISSPEGTLQGTGILCPGECATITVAFMNGTPPYILDLEFSSNALPFSFPFTVPGFEVNDMINICYEEGGILPTFDQSTNTLTLPGIVGGFSGTLDLVALSDQTCSNIPQNGPNINFTFLVKPDAFPASLEGCDDGSGNAEFDLSSIESTILGNQGGSVEFYSDFGLTNLISSPYYSSDATIYAVVVGTNGCLSDPVEVQLSVLGNGDAGVITFLCESETSCVICDEDGMLGEEVELTINFEDPGMDYYIEIIYFINGIQMTYEGTVPGSGGGIPFFIDANASFQIIAVTPSDDCRDVTDMPPAIDITYLLRPDIDPIDPFEVCEPVVLPPITGTNLTGSEYYSTSEDGTGAIFLAGDIVNFDTPLYAFSGVYPDCYDAENFFILIGDETVLTAPDNDTTCGFYILPPIPGQGMGSTVQYYTEMDGMGTSYLPGDTLFVSDSLFLFDPEGDCPSNQPYFHINLAGTIIYDSLGIIFGCEEVILPEITGQGVTDSARYFTMPDGNGIQFFTGDTIMISDTFYMFDPTTQCTQDTAFLITNIGGGTLYNDIPDTSACGFYILPSIEGDNVGINAMYFSQPNGGGIGYNPGDSIFTNTDMFVFDTTSNCNINQPQFLISVLQEVVFDVPNNLVDCEPITLPQISGQNLTGNENYFSGPNGSGVIIPEGTIFNSDTVIYLYSGASSCPVDQEIIISINNLQSGIANNYSLCSGTGIINLWDGVLPPFTPGGEWSEQGSSVFDLTDPENVIIPEDVIPGTYRFAYTLIIPGCPIAQTVHRVNIVSTPEVGNDTIISFCGNPTSIDLLEYSSPDGADTAFESLSGSVTLNGSIADISGLPEGNYTFYVISENNDLNIPPLECVDTAEITLILSENPSAGDNNSTTVCKGNLINLNDYISNFDNIGVFELPAFPGVLNGSDLDTEQLPLGTATAWHILPESGGCAADTAFITINVIDKPDAGINVNVSECNTGTYDLLDYISVADQSGEFISIDNNYVINGTILSVDAAGSTEIYYVLGDGITCPKDSSVISIEIFDPQPQNFEDTTCEDTYDFEGITFTPSNNSQEVILTSISGCDSIVNVEITFNSAVTTDLNTSICPGDSIVVNGNVYNPTLLSGQEIFAGMAANGCDSIVNINLTLNDGFETSIDTSTCNPDISIIIGNDEYNALNPTGSTTLQTQEGCDSTINVNINIIPFTYTFDIIQPECEGDNGTFTITEFNGAQAITIIENGQSSDYTLADLPIELAYAPGSYQITINSIDGICGNTETVVIDEAIIPEGNIIATMISDSVWQLSLEIDANVTTYFWTALGGTLDCWDCPNPILTGAAEVVLIYDYGLICTDNTSLTLEILIDNSFHLPNIFSPNGDQINDNFTIRVNEDNTLIIETFEIYDRWGNQVISLNDIAPSDGQILWDGKMNGKNVTPGVYVYVIKVKNGNESITNFGEITIIR